MKNVTKLKHDWSLIDDGVYKMTDTHNYRLLPPKWAVGFQVSETQRDDRELEEWVRRAGEMLVDEILKNPHVKEEVDRKIQRAREEGYFGGLEEVKFGKRFDLDAHSTP